MPTITSSTGTRKALIGILILWFLLSLGSLLLRVFEGDGVKPAFLVILYVAFPIAIFWVAYSNSIPVREIWSMQQV